MAQLCAEARGIGRRVGRRRGSSLAIALVLISLTSLALAWMAQSVIFSQRLNKRRLDLSRALYSAEAGVSIIQHFGNYPDQFTMDATLFQLGSGTTGAELFPNLASALAGGEYEIDHDDLAGMGFGDLVSQYNYDVATIDRITLIPADASDPVSCFFKIESVGRGFSGIERTVLAYIDAHKPVLEIEVPGALLSYNVASAFGNARIHWGESWSKGSFDMLNRSQVDYLRSGSSVHDPHAKYRTEGVINFPSNWSWGEGRDLYDPTSSTPGAPPAGGSYEAAFEQHLPSGTLEWPEWDYQTFKDMAKAHGRYYSTDASGNIYRDGIEDNAHLVDFYSEFTVPDRSVAPYDLVFIDTIDGNPPDALGTNMAEITVSGNSNGTKGVMYICANMDAAGIGSPPDLPGAEDPDGNTTTLSQIFHDGVIYSEGTIEMSGNAGVYGSVIAQRGFSGGGTPNVYYNSDLKDGLEMTKGNIGSLLKVVMQRNYGGDGS